MSHGAGAAGPLPRNRAALALIVGMHMLALFGWMRQRPLTLPSPLPGLARATTILWLPLTARSEPAAQPLPPPPPRPMPRPLPRPLPPPALAGVPAAPAIADPPAIAAPAAPAAPATTSLPATAAPPAAPALDDARAPLSVRDAIREQQAADGGFGMNLSKRQAARIDRELRGGKSGIPDEPDTPMGRFRRGLERAHVAPSRAVYEDSYTAPDGTVVYRKRIGNATICRRSGSVSPLGMRGMVMGHEAGDVPCPKGVQWQHD